jgi:crotonobetainyl-CoA:carnitine CoA-transferase CaiB-like acyl-CoA transferase
MNYQPLKGIRILDLTSVIVGPACTWRLGQYGAEIIKVESPEGDLMRGLGGLSPTGQHSGAYLHLNRGKRNLCLDLKKSGSRDVMQSLLKTVDVVVGNMRPKALARLGLDADSILLNYPEKIYCLITGYGTDGPYAGEPAYDSVVQAATGMAGLMLARDGKPAYVPMLICDHVVGEITAGAVMAALLQRASTGKGCSIEVPMFETMSAFVLQEHLAQQSFEPPVGEPGDLRLLSSHNRPVQTSDGWISFTVNTDAQVKALLQVTGRSSLQHDPRFGSVSARAKNVKEWFEVRGAPLTQKTTSEWLNILQAADIAAKPCHTLETLQHDPHLQAVSLFGIEEHPTEGKTKTVRSTIRFNDSYAPLQSCAQPRGWSSRTVLEELGYSSKLIDSLVAEGAVFEFQQ